MNIHTSNLLNPYNISHGRLAEAQLVAAFECAFSLGTDTGGSILNLLPTAVLGMTTFGTVSRYGVVGFAPSLNRQVP